MTETWCCSLATCGYVELDAEGGSIKLVIDGDSLARLSGGEMGGGGTLAATCGFDSYSPPRIGSYRCPEEAGLGLGVEGVTLMCDKLGLWCKI